MMSERIKQPRTCARCGKEGNQHNIYAHHKNQDWTDNRLENLLFLCSSCHKQFHTGRWNYEDSDIGFQHVTVKPETKPLIPQEDRRIVIPDKVYLGLEDMAANERKKVKDEVIKAMITPKSLAQHIIANAVKRAVRP